MANKVKRNYFPSEQIEVRNKIASAIESGAIKPGQLLPGIASVSNDQGYSYHSVRSALAILKAEGYITKSEDNRFHVVGPKHKSPKTKVREIENHEKRPAVGLVESLTTKPSKKEMVKKYILENYISKKVLPVNNRKFLSEMFNCSGFTVDQAKRELAAAGALKRRSDGRFYIGDKNADSTPKHELKMTEKIPGGITESHEFMKQPNFEFSIVSNVPGIQVAVSPNGSYSFVIHVNEYKQ